MRIVVSFGKISYSIEAYFFFGSGSLHVMVAQLDERFANRTKNPKSKGVLFNNWRLGRRSERIINCSYSWIRE